MFLEIELRVSFLVFMALLGFFVGKRLEIRPKDLSSLLVYVVSPFVVFVSVMQASVGWSGLYFVLGAFVVSCVMAFLAHCLGRFLWRDARSNLLAFSGGTGNTGYFGLPLVMGLLENKSVVLAVCIIIGVNLYEFSYGYYLISRGKYDVRTSLRKVFRMPMLYAAALAFIFKGLGVELHPAMVSGLENFKGAYSVLGMMVIGITLASFFRLSFDLKFTLYALAWRHLVCPAIIFAVSSWFLTPGSEPWGLIILMSSAPMAANVVVISNELGVYPEKSASAVMLSTLLSTVTVPLMVVAANMS